MLAELGHFALILALLLSLLLGTVPLLGAQHGRPAWMAAARPAALAQGACMVLAWACLLAVFAQPDFSVRNVAENANTHLPLAYRLAAAWGSHEGSMLLWLVMQSLWLAAVALWGRHLPAAQQARVLAVMGWLAAGFTLFVLVASNPFLRLFPIPAEGRDLNPLLQDLGMVLHPPLLYMGYVGFSVAFAFAMAALLEGARDAGWARLARPWTTAAWCCLTLGVALGSWWAYRELGWGGWWFWDPVENAAFMPWLVGTALLHALAMAERRGSFQAWAVLLAIACFSLSLLGTFLVRSGVLSSVHAFAVDPRRGIFILAFLVAVIGGSLALYAWRAPRLARGSGFALLSRETLMLANTVLLAVAAGTVLLGTFYPLLLEVFGAARISVGPPYFDAVFAPLMLPVVALMAVAPLVRWQATAGAELWRRLRWPLGLGAMAGAAAAWRLGGSVWLGLGLVLVAWVALASAVAVLAAQARARQAGGGWPPRAWWGMLLAHAGVAVFVLGVALVRSQQSEQDLRMAPGEQVAFAGRQLRFEGVRPATGPNYAAQQGLFTVQQGQDAPLTLAPEKRTYTAMPATPMTEAAIASGWTGDLYLALGEPVGQGAWTLRVHHKPFVGWIWGGCALMALGGALAATGRRRKATPV